MGPTWVLSAQGGPHVGLMNLAIWDMLAIIVQADYMIVYNKEVWTWHQYIYQNEMLKSPRLPPWKLYKKLIQSLIEQNCLKTFEET